MAWILVPWISIYIANLSYAFTNIQSRYLWRVVLNNSTKMSQLFWIYQPMCHCEQCFIKYDNVKLTSVWWFPCHSYIQYWHTLNWSILITVEWYIILSTFGNYKQTCLNGYSYQYYLLQLSSSDIFAILYFWHFT